LPLAPVISYAIKQ